MTTTTSATARTRRRPSRAGRSEGQRGIVLMISLIMILVISVLAVTSMRNVASSEGVSGNVRTTELATQAADIALRHCESSVVRQMDGSAPTAADPTFGSAGTDAWKNLGNWDGSTPTFFRVDAPLMAGTYVRNPECMVEFLAGGIASRPASFIVTARGFGPEVRTAAGAGRPVGTVVWLQSTLDFQ